MNCVSFHNGEDELTLLVCRLPPGFVFAGLVAISYGQHNAQGLLFTANSTYFSGLVDFAYSITKGTSLLICGYVLPYRPSNTVT